MHPDCFLAEPLGPHVHPTPGGPLSIRWLGTAGFELRSGDHTLLIDPYITRVRLSAMLAGPARPDLAAVDATLGPQPRADAIVVGHSHFDHVLDVPYIARRTGALVIGSESTANLMRSTGLPEDRIATCRGREVFEIGPFRITMTPSEHSRFGLGGTVPFAGEIPPCCDAGPLRARDYRCGQVFGIAVEVAGLSLYHVGSANLIDDEIRHRDVDLLLMCISGRNATERFLPRLLGRVRPRVVVPTHYDNFFRPLTAPMKLLPRTAFGRLVDDIWRFDRELTVRTIRMGGRLSVAP